MAILARIDTPRLVAFFDLQTVLISLAIVISVYVFTILIIRPLLSPLRHVPGPGRGNLVYGHIGDIIRGGPGEYHKAWGDKYGGIVRYFGVAGTDRLMVSDPKALRHMLVEHAYEFPKSEISRAELARLLGKGVLFAEGDDHKRQRRILNPAFVSSHVARLTPIFFEKAQRLVDLWTEQIDTDSASAEKKEDSAVISVDRGLSRCTLDIIGAAGFDYDFGAMENADNALAATFNRMINGNRQGTLAVAMFFLFRAFPILWYLPTERVQRIKQNMDNMTKESTLIVENKRLSDPEHNGRDLLTLLLKANESESPKTAMSESEIRGQLTTFILAGHETTATALTWALYEIANRPEMQSRLREEVRSHGLTPDSVRSGWTFEQLNSLPYLDAFTKEVLRLHPPVPGTIREAATDSVIPLSKPLPNGDTSLFVPARTTLFLSICHTNQSKALWGPSAEDFQPERWLTDLPERAKEETSQYALWANQLTFFSGTRGCIGYRFAVAEFKAILAALVTSFEFSSGLKEGEVIEKRSAIVTKSYIKGKTKDGNQMPIRVRRAEK